jgi:hypothetical protein
MTPTRIIQVALVLLVVGVALGLLADGTALRAAGLAVGGVACVLLVAAAFLAVGLSEDREREQRERPGGPMARP